MPASLGGDTIGSIRVPASLCGVIGFKPTTGRWPRSGVAPVSHTLDTTGVFARSVDDCILIDPVVTRDETPDNNVHAGLKGITLSYAPRQYLELVAPEVATPQRCMDPTCTACRSRLYLGRGLPPCAGSRTKGNQASVRRSFSEYWRGGTAVANYAVHCTDDRARRQNHWVAKRRANSSSQITQSPPVPQVFRVSVSRSGCPTRACRSD
ncbi:amidase family protein [Caballeronia ptereochthonis]|uniref:amidase family protein n=1 Tax=Caballeronia ptereochthonis TaxID=1777144 RepID=UPI0035B52F78